MDCRRARLAIARIPAPSVAAFFRMSPAPQPRQWTALSVHGVFRRFADLSNSLSRVGALPRVRALIVGAVFRIRADDEKIPAGVDQPMAGPGG